MEDSMRNFRITFRKTGALPALANSTELQSLLRALSSALRASSYEPGNRAGSVTGTNSVVCLYGKFQPGWPGWPTKKQRKWWNINLHYLRLSELCGPLQLLIKLFCTLPWSGNTYKSKIIPFWPLSGESEGILSKMFRPGHRAGVFIWEYFDLGYRDLGNRASPAPHMNTSMF